MTPQQLAEAVARDMHGRDAVAQALGITILTVSPGRASAQMLVRPNMLNCQGMCHGGMIFTLADACFGYACHSRNHNTVGQHTETSFIIPVLPGTILTATAEERASTGRSGIYDITVSDDRGRIVSLFRGHARQIAGNVIDVNSSGADA